MIPWVFLLTFIEISKRHILLHIFQPTYTSLLCLYTLSLLQRAYTYLEILGLSRKRTKVFTCQRVVFTPHHPFAHIDLWPLN